MILNLLVRPKLSKGLAKFAYWLIKLTNSFIIVTGNAFIERSIAEISCALQVFFTVVLYMNN